MKKAPWTSRGRRRCPREQYIIRSIISDQVVADYTSYYSAPSDRRHMDVDAERTRTARGCGRGKSPPKIADVDMPLWTQTRHGRGLAADAGVSSMGFLTEERRPTSDESDGRHERRPTTDERQERRGQRSTRATRATRATSDESDGRRGRRATRATSDEHPAHSG
jgi:hypothetical protein